MALHRGRLFALLIVLLAAVLGAAAQPTDGVLTRGLPTSGEVSAERTLRLTYTIEQTSLVTIQAAGDAARPTLRVLLDGVELGAEPNTGAANAIQLNVVLTPGTYIVEVGSANGTAGPALVIVQSEVPIPTNTLEIGASVGSVVDPETPVALFDFGPLPQAAYLYVDSGLSEWGVDVTLINADTGQIVGRSSGDTLGMRFRLAPVNALYQLQLRASGAGVAEPYTVCLALVSAGGCEGPALAVTPDLVPQPSPVSTEEVTAAGCTVTPANAGGVNIRQSATTGSIVVGALPGGGVATVLGISPDRSFYSIQFNAIQGWVAASVVTTSGDCADLATVNPPPVISPPTATPPPTNTPVPATPVPSGPCLLTLTAPTYVYMTTIELIDHLYDQVQSGELIPTGRTADNQWYRLNYGGHTWIPTHAIGQTVTRSGNCGNLPVVTP